MIGWNIFINLLQQTYIKIANWVESNADPSRQIDLKPALTCFLKDYINQSLVYPWIN